MLILIFVNQNLVLLDVLSNPCQLNINEVNVKIKTLLTVLSVTAFLSLIACKNTAEPIDSKALLQHSFELAMVDGKALSVEKIPHIQFNDGMRVSGIICNNFMGQGELANNTLTVAQMATTNMMCPDPKLNELEFKMSEMLMNGATISLNNNVLTLEGSGLTMTFNLRDKLN